MFKELRTNGQMGLIEMEPTIPQKAAAPLEQAIQMRHLHRCAPFDPSDPDFHEKDLNELQAQLKGIRKSVPSGFYVEKQGYSWESEMGLWEIRSLALPLGVSNQEFESIPRKILPSGEGKQITTNVWTEFRA